MAARRQQAAAFLAPVVAFVAVLVLACWALAGGAFGLLLGSVIAVYCLAVVGLDLVVGRAGMLHSGYGISFGLGAYTVAVAAQNWKAVPEVLALLVAMILGALTAGCIGIVIARFSGYVFALVTLATAAAAESMARALPQIGGTAGLGGISRNLLGTGQLDDVQVFVVVAVIAAVVVLLSQKLRRSRVGRAVEALRLVPHVAEASGVDLARLRLQLLVVSGAIGSLAGGLFAVVVQYVSPDLLGVQTSVSILVMNVVGGLGIAWGGVPGALIVRGLPQAVQGLGNHQLVAVGLVTLAVVLWFPRGVAGGLIDLYDRAVRRLRGADAPSTVFVGATVQYRNLQLPPSTGRESLIVRHLIVRFGGLVALNGVSLEVPPGRITALVGPNGSGKTTLVNAVVGRVAPAAGEVWLGSTDLTRLSVDKRVRTGISRTFQLVSLCQSLTVLENVMLGAHTRSACGLVRGALPALDRREERALAERAAGVLATLGLSSLAGAFPAQLTSGQVRLVEIARCLMTEAHVVLLDEPAASLNEVERRWLAGVIGALAASGRAVLLIEHDSEFVMSLADSIVVLSDGKVVAAGDPDRIRGDPGVVAAYWGEAVGA